LILVAKSLSPSRSPFRRKFLSFVVGLLIVSAGISAKAHLPVGAAGHISTLLAQLYVAESFGGEVAETAQRFTRLDAEKIRFSQATFSKSGKTEDGSEYTVEANVQWLREHPDQDLPFGEPIRVFRKEPFMDEWGPATRSGYTGDPKNLVNGEIYTLDHRRLVAYKQAGRKSVPFQWADLNTVRDQRWKFSTTNGGISITPQ